MSAFFGYCLFLLVKKKKKKKEGFAGTARSQNQRLVGLQHIDLHCLQIVCPDNFKAHGMKGSDQPHANIFCSIRQDCHLRPSQKIYNVNG